MTSSSERELLRLIEGFEDQTLDEADHERLLEALRTDPEARGLYLEYFHMAGFLRLEARNRQLLGRPMAFSRSSRPAVRRRVVQSLVAAAACIAAALVVFFFIRTHESDQFASLEVSPGAVFQVVGQDVSTEERGLEPGSSLELRHGVAQLQLLRGVTAVLNAPARIRYTDPGTLVLDHGEGWFEVGEEGRGFTVETPGLRVIDLGTRFGVRVNPEDLRQEVHVALGTVRVESGTDREVLGGGEAVVLGDNGDLGRIPGDGGAFAKSLDDALPPYIHWSFDEPSGGRFESGGTHPDASSFPAVVRHLRGEPPQSPHGRGRVDGALALHGMGDWASTEWPGIGGDEPRSVALWMKVPPPDERLWEGLRDPATRRGLVAWGAYRYGTEAGAWEIDFPRNSGGNSTILTTSYGARPAAFVSGEDLLDDTWHHVASVFSGSEGSEGSDKWTITHYVDGEPVETVPVDQDGPAPPKPRTETGGDAFPVRFGLGAVEADADLPTADGLIDEVHIFAGALTPDQVAYLARRGAVDSGNRK